MPWSSMALERARPMPIPGRRGHGADQRITIDSQRTIARTWPRDIPTARRGPSSRVRSKTEAARGC